MDDIFYNINKIKGSKQDSINSGTNPFNDFDYSADQLSEEILDSQLRRQLRV